MHSSDMRSKIKHLVIEFSAPNLNAACVNPWMRPPSHREGSIPIKIILN